jgi:hypothetical protein
MTDKLKIYTRLCPRCNKYHKTTTHSSNAICKKCKRKTWVDVIPITSTFKGRREVKEDRKNKLEIIRQKLNIGMKGGENGRTNNNK